MAGLTEDYVLISANWVVLDAHEVRIAAPPTGEAVYSLETDLDVANYGERYGVPLEAHGSPGQEVCRVLPSARPNNEFRAALTRVEEHGLQGSMCP